MTIFLDGAPSISQQQFLNCCLPLFGLSISRDSYKYLKFTMKVSHQKKNLLSRHRRTLFWHCLTLQEVWHPREQRALHCCICLSSDTQRMCGPALAEHMLESTKTGDSPRLPFLIQSASHAWFAHAKSLLRIGGKKIHL